MSDTKNGAQVAFRLDAQGNLIIDAHNRQLIISRQSLTPESRTALIAFFKSVREVRSLDELAPGEEVTVCEHCTYRDYNNNIYPLEPTDKVYERDVIEQLLKRTPPVRLLHEGIATEDEAMLKQSVINAANRGGVAVVAAVRRTVDALRG